MNFTLKTLFAASALALATHASAQITFYEGNGFRGRAFTANAPISNFERSGFNDRASSVTVDGGRWEVCDDAGFRGRCVVLRKGSYESLEGMGLANRISSARPTAPNRRYENEAPAPIAAPNYEYRRRPNERVFEATVTSVRAVVGPPEQRCWVERERVGNQGRGEANVAGGVLGAIIGGVLGHQVGGGRGQDAATAGGAIAGGLIGANTGRNGYAEDRNLQRCETVSGPPDHWDVTYVFRNVEHRVQMTAPPGRTIAVNQRGEPRQ